MKIDVHSYAEGFVHEDEILVNARTRGAEVGAIDASQGTGSFLSFLAHLISAQSVVEVGTGSGVGSLWLLRGMIESGTLTSIDNEAEHARITRLTLNEAQISPQRYRLITNPVVDVMGKLTDRAYDLVVLRHDAEDLSFSVDEAYRMLRTGGVLAVDNFFGDGKISDPAQRDPRTIALRECGKAIRAATKLWSASLIGVGDGLLLATKL
jgi:predicted O-methyltransferase YrrM